MKDMSFDFDSEISRRDTGSFKWDSAGDAEVIPLWVADMDFAVAPAIVQALHERVEHKIFGYNIVPESYYQAIIDWYARRHGWSVAREWIMPVPGVVPAVSCVIKALTQPGDKVMLLTPAYNCFFSSIRNNGCVAAACPLVPVGDSYVVDYEALERCAADDSVTLCLLCNPHNPVGRVWREDELVRISDICARHHVIVVSDEIHSEIVMPGQRYIPYASVSVTPGRNITLCSPTKGFNIAGLQIANIFCDNALWRKKIDRAINDNEVCDLNPFGIIALQAAYNDSAAWLDAMIDYVWGNYCVLREFVARAIPEWRVCSLEGTYLAWIDVRGLGIGSVPLCERLLTDGKVWVNDGVMYGDSDSEEHIRVNLACPRRRLATALQRIAAVIRTLRTHPCNIS